MKFAKYLKEQILQIDVWDGGEDQTHYGTARVPLVRLLRQGQPSIVMPFQFDLYEQTLNTWVGQLQMLITNEGHRVDMDEIAHPEAKLGSPDRLGRSRD